jgi:hypothetical protein
MLLSLQDLVRDTSARRFAQYLDFNLLDDIPKFDGFYSLDLKEYSDLFGNFYYATNDSERFLQRANIPFADLTTDLRYPSFGNHWTPAGHYFVCDKIDQFLRLGDYMPE